MKRTTRFFIVSLSFALVFFLVSSAWAQIDVGDYTISGEAEVGGLPRHKNGNAAKFEEYRDIPESVIVPQLQLMIGGKKEDFYLDFDSSKPGRDDQNYRLRFGRYGLIDVQFEWDQVLHNFNLDTARTPYYMKGGNYTLANRPIAVDSATFRTWIEGNASPIDLRLLDKNAKIKIRYTPTPGWSFMGSYWVQNNDGGRAFSTVFGSSSTNGNVAELVEPIDYQTHNIELGGEYAGDGWSLGLKYNGSIFHNSTSTLSWDNPDRAVGAGACTDSATWNSATGAGSCRGRLDLYPSNQAHTFTLTGAARLPFKTQFLGTVSTGWRHQDDAFLPFTINTCYGSGAVPASCSDGALTAMPALSRGSLKGDVRPTMVNLSLVNNSVDRLSLKATYRFYDLENLTKKVYTDNTVMNDNGPLRTDWDATEPYQYSKNNLGLEAGYNFTRWLTGKLNFGWERLHRGNFLKDNLHVMQSDELKIGPTVDIKPNSWLLLRATYRHSMRDAPNYLGIDQTVATNQRRMFFMAKRDENKASLFADVTPWETLGFHGGFEFTGDTYPATTFGVQDTFNYSPSIGALYAPLEWLKLFADYNWDRVDWRQDSNSSTGFRARGQDRVNTFSLGSDMDLIKNLLGFRIQYGFSQGFSRNRNSGASSVDYPNLTNTWHELLTRLEYRLHKNVGLQLGYYFNHYDSKDFGVDIMRVWMGNYDTSQGQVRSVYLGDRFKGPYTAQVGFVNLRLSF